MSVYTKITENDLSDYLEHYSIGKIIALTGISDGIENTNYLLTTDQGEFIFTIFENIKINDINQYLLFMNHVNKKGLLSPKVMKTDKQELFFTIDDKPSAIIEKLDGASVVNPNEKKCGDVGSILGDFHNYNSDFNITIPNSRDLSWCKSTNEKLSKTLSKPELLLIEQAIKHQESLQSQKLPTGMIHADLFRDNVLFYKEKISGMIDFYYSCQGFLIYDLAVVVNDWCTEPDGLLNELKLKKLLNNYNIKRVITDNEKTHWQNALISAALRFYLSRLLDLHFPKIGEMTHIKDPFVFKSILEDRIKNSYLINL